MAGHWIHSTLLVARVEHVLPHEGVQQRSWRLRGWRVNRVDVGASVVHGPSEEGAAGTIGGAAECVRSSGLPDSPAACREEAQTAGDTTGRVGDLDSPDSAPASLPLRPAH